MNRNELLALAEEIYIIKMAVDPPQWDYQQVARECLNMATQFALAVQAEQDQGSTPTDAPVLRGLHPASQTETAPAETSSSIGSTPPPGSTTGIAASKGATALTAAATEAEARGKELRAGTGSQSRQSQEQGAPVGRFVQVANPYPPHHR